MENKLQKAVLFVHRDALTVSPALQLTKHTLLVSALSPQLRSLLSPAHSGPFTGTQGTWGPKNCPRLMFACPKVGTPFLHMSHGKGVYPRGHILVVPWISGWPWAEQLCFGDSKTLFGAIGHFGRGRCWGWPWSLCAHAALPLWPLPLTALGAFKQILSLQVL